MGPGWVRCRGLQPRTAATRVCAHAMPAGVASMLVLIFLSPASTAMDPSGSTSMITTSPSLMSPEGGGAYSTQSGSGQGLSKCACSRGQGLSTCACSRGQGLSTCACIFILVGKAHAYTDSTHAARTPTRNTQRRRQTTLGSQMGTSVALSAPPNPKP